MGRRRRDGGPPSPVPRGGRPCLLSGDRGHGLHGPENSVQSGPLLPGFGPQGGGIVKTQLSSLMARELVRYRGRHGGYSPLGFGPYLADHLDRLEGGPRPSPLGDIGLISDTPKLWGTSGDWSKAVAAAGLLAGPMVSLRTSENMDLSRDRVVEWVLWMVLEREVTLVHVTPPSRIVDGRRRRRSLLLCKVLARRCFPQVSSFRA